jgi:hypothetical protein
MAINPVHNLARGMARPLYNAYRIATTISEKICEADEPTAILIGRVVELLEDINDKLVQIAKLTGSRVDAN